MSKDPDHLGVIKYLCEEMHLNPENKNGEGYNGVQCAVLAGNLDIVKYLIEEQHVNTQVVYQKGGYTLLHLAVISGNLDVVQYITNHTQVDPEAKDNQGRTAMELAAYLENMRRSQRTNN